MHPFLPKLAGKKKKKKNTTGKKDLFPQKLSTSLCHPAPFWNIIQLVSDLRATSSVFFSTSVRSSS